MARRNARGVVELTVAALATLLVHGAFLSVIDLTTGVRSDSPRHPDAVGAGANAGSNSGEWIERKMTVRLLSEVSKEEVLSPLEALLKVAVTEVSAVEVLGQNSDPLPPIFPERDGDESVDSAAELVARARLSGVYESQIRARIMRAWRRPDGVVLSGASNCRALIRQTESGKISEVELAYEGCDWTDEMRASLVRAIFSASPLPAPPHPSVFVDVFSLKF
jgi:hypothetical protein